MNPIDFWMNPDSAKGVEGISDDYLVSCRPEFFPSLISVSEYIVSVFEQNIPSGSSVLELGANCGRNLHYLREASYKVLGIELNPDTQAYNKWSVPVVIGSIESLLPKTKDNQFDVVFTQSVLMHLPPSSDFVFTEMSRVARSYIVTNEVEDTEGHHGSPTKWSRDYGEIFETLGWEQLYSVEARRVNISRTVTRVFGRADS